MTVTDTYFSKKISIAPLAFFRLCFGLMMSFSIVRFWANGWIHQLYIEPKYFFSYFGFEFISPPGQFTYLLFIICGISSLMVAAGLFYRIASVSLFLSFTCIELLDKSTYLNHYYFISLMSLILIFLPANRSFSLDTLRKPESELAFIPAWNTGVLKLMMGIVYVFAGLAKVNSDWLIHALPLKIWLPARNDMPLIGSLFNHEFTAYAFSIIGCIYDLSIPFLLLYRKTRVYAYLAVIIFHVLTAILFPIGMFPHIMMVAALIFFPPEFHQRIISFLRKIFRSPANTNIVAEYKSNRLLIPFFAVFFSIQILFPFRHLAYPGELFWTEEGYRFSWRVMLMEKAGYAQFTVKDKNDRSQVVNNSEFLTPLQEKMMATQPDMILQYAQILSRYFADKGFNQPEVYVDSYVSLNGRLGKALINPDVNLAVQKESFKHKTWINPFNDEIKGF